METCFANVLQPGDRVARVRQRRLFQADGGRRVAPGREGRHCSSSSGERPVDPARLARAPGRKQLQGRRPGPWRDLDGRRQPRGRGRRASQGHAASSSSSTRSRPSAAYRVAVDEWGVDALYSCSQKCLSCSPGLSPGHAFRPGLRGREGEAGQAPELLPRPHPDHQLLGRRKAGLPSHGAHQPPLRPVRGAPAHHGRRRGEGLRPPRSRLSPPGRRAARPRARAARGAGGPAAHSHRRRASPRAWTMPTSGPACGSST